VVIVAGRGEMTCASGAVVAVTRGDTLLVPYAAGACTLRGMVTAIRCRAPI
jgi:mannose-6-phosphate isomerase